MKQLRFAHLALVACLLLSLTAKSAQIEAPPITAIRIGTIQHNPPYVTENPSSGIDMDTIRAAFAVVGLDVEFVHAPLTRISSLLQSRRIDGITTLVSMGRQCKLSKVFSYWHDGVVVRKGLEKSVTKVSDLSGLQVGMFPSASAVFADKLGPYAATFASETIINATPSVLRLLQYERIDAYIGDIWGLEALTLDDDKTSIPFRVAITFEPTPRYVCFLDEVVRAQFNNGLDELQAAGHLEKITARYRKQP